MKYTSYRKIASEDIYENKITLFKKWYVDDTTFNNFDDNEIFICKAIYPSFNGVYYKDIIPIGSSLVLPSESVNPDGTYQRQIYSSINHLYYKEYKDIFSTFCYNKNRIQSLFSSASVIYLPRNAFGNAIKPNSIILNDYSTGTLINIIDDGNGNLIDTSIATESFLDASRKIAEVSSTTYSKLASDNTGKFGKHNTITGKLNAKWYMEAEFNDISINPGIITSANTSGSTNSLDVGGPSASVALYSSYANKSATFNMDEGYILSIWAKGDISQQITGVDGYAYIVSKRGEYENIYVDTSTNKVLFGDIYQDIPHYPYELKVDVNTGILNASISDGINTFSFDSTSSILDNITHSIVFRYHESLAYLYVDGVLHASGSANPTYSINNNSYIYLGRKSIKENDSRFIGLIDQFDLYAYGSASVEQITALSEPASAYQTNIVGNVFYEHGVLVISSIYDKYKNVACGTGSILNNAFDYSDNKGFNLSWKSVVDKFEHEIVCKIPKSELNSTINPSIAKTDSEAIRNECTGSNFTPYITTIGLYNDHGQLLAVGKLSDPIRKRKDVDMNIIVKFDVQ